MRPLANTSFTLSDDPESAPNVYTVMVDEDNMFCHLFHVEAFICGDLEPPLFRDWEMNFNIPITSDSFSFNSQSLYLHCRFYISSHIQSKWFFISSSTSLHMATL